MTNANILTSTAAGSDSSLCFFLEDDFTDGLCGNVRWKNPINSTTVCWLAAIRTNKTTTNSL